MLKVAGIVPGFPHIQFNKFSVFVTWFQQFSHGKDMEPEQIKSLRAETKKLREHVLFHANIIVITFFNAGDVSIWNLDILYDFIIIDKAGKSIEPDMWNILSIQSRIYIQTGDHKQVGPIIQIKFEDSNFSG